MRPGASTRPVVLLGDPVAHSLSPSLHNAAFAALGLDLVYLACRVPPASLGDAVHALTVLGAAGANVTVPHKVSAAQLVDELSPEAAATGAVNTLVPGERGWRGANTDVQGFADAAVEAFGPVSGCRMVVLGAGGAARAAALAGLQRLRCARVTIAGRNAATGADVVARLRAHDPAGSLELADAAGAGRAVNEADLLVNATPLGMQPEWDPSPLPRDARLDARHLVFDMTYAGAPSRLQRDAEAAGARAVDGRAMLLHQAAASFRLWTGQDMPLDIAREVLFTPAGT